MFPLLNGVENQLANYPTILIKFLNELEVIFKQIYFVFYLVCLRSLN